MLHLIMRYLTTSTMAHLVKFGTTWGSLPWKYRWCSHWPRNDRGQYKVYNMTLQGGHPLTQARAEKPTQPSHLVVFCRDDVENPPMCGTFFPWKEPIKRGISNGGLVESILKWYLYDHVFLVVEFGPWHFQVAIGFHPMAQVHCVQVQDSLHRLLQTAIIIFNKFHQQSKARQTI